MHVLQFAVFNNVLFLAESAKGHIQATVRALSKAQLQSGQLQDADQDLAVLLGMVLEANWPMGKDCEFTR